MKETNQELTKCLQATLEKMERSLNSIEDAIVWVNEQGKIQWCSKKFNQLTGLSNKQVLNKKIETILPINKKNKNWLQNTKNNCNDSNPKVTKFEMAYQDKYFEISAQCIQKIGEKVNIIVVIHDLTSHYINEKNLEKMNKELVQKDLINSRLASIVEYSDEAIISLNLDGEIETWNKGAEHLYGYKAEEVIGKPAIFVYPDNKKKDFYYALEQIKIGHNIEFLETNRKHRDGHIFPVSLKISPIKNNMGEVIGSCKIVRDITEWKKIINLKNDFISVVSHELRTPLTSIQGSLSLLTQGAMGKIPPKIMNLLDICENNSIRLIGIINDILDMQKLESNNFELHLDQIDIEILINEAISVNQAYADKFKKVFHLIKKDTGKVNADRFRILQVLDNLISNAIKFSNDPEIKIAICKKNKSMRVEVTNRGVGIDKEFYPKLFQKFSQVQDKTNRVNTGTGLGLAISKEIIEKHNGVIGFESKKNKETTFYFELPLMKEKRLFNKYIKKIPAVLICEDNKKISGLLKKELKKNSIQTIVTNTTKEAKKLYLREHYDAVIVNITLSEQEGINILKELKELAPDLLIIILSSVSKGNKILGNFIPIIDLLEVPLKPDRLLNAVKLIKKKTIVNAPNILYIEDDVDLIKIVGNLLEHEANISIATSIAEAKISLKEKNYNLVILDVVLPDGSGIELLPIISQKNIPIVVFSAYDFPKNYLTYVAKVFTKTETSLMDLIKQIKIWL